MTMSLEDLKKHASAMENPEHRAIMQEALATLEDHEVAQGKRGPGRPRKAAGERKLRRTYTLSPDVIAFLEGQDNASGLIEDLVRAEMKKEQEQAKQEFVAQWGEVFFEDEYEIYVEGSEGAHCISKQRSSDPSAWFVERAVEGRAYEVEGGVLVCTSDTGGWEWLEE